MSSKNYENPSKNHGDCVVGIDGETAIIFDCGSEEHAKRVIEILDEHEVDKATVILSHNDDDHFKGISYLIKEGRVSKLFTILLLKYKKELLDIIDDGRRKLSSIGNSIKDLYDNIATLSGTVELRDVYADEAELPSQAKRIGPDLEYMLEAAAKGLDGREGDTIDNETITNAASVQINLTIGSAKLLLTGDCAPEAIPENEDLSEYSHIQLPHHGKPSLAEKIFERLGQNNDIIYVVSDNTGNSNGGSDDLNTQERNIKNTKNGDVDIDTSSSSSYNTYTRRTLGI